MLIRPVEKSFLIKIKLPNYLFFFKQMGEAKDFILIEFHMISNYYFFKRFF